MATVIGERSACISGIGMSAVGRRLGRSGLDLTLEACTRAIADAGLTPADINGLATFPGGSDYRGGASTSQVHDAMRLQLDWHHAVAEGPAQLSAVVAAAAAIHAGFARHVLVYRTVMEASAQGPGRRQGAALVKHIPEAQWMVPFGSVNATNWVALYAQAHFHRYGTTREHLGAVALNARTNAALNEAAVLRTPLTLEQYMTSRTISSPLCLYDCDVPVDGSTAIVISTVDYATHAPSGGVRIEAIGTATRRRPSWDQTPDLTTTTIADAAAHMWQRTDLKPADVDVGALYDGFTILTLLSLEALGFCGQGESGPFVADPSNISIRGRLPLATDGGQLSAGRLHGYGYIHEACVQLRRQAGARQIQDAQVAVVTNGAGPLGAAMLLTADR